MRPFRFGVVFTQATTGSGWTEFARRLEGEGFATLLVADHHTNPMACGPLIVAAAAATTTLRVGSYVYNNDFRHPALLAKEAATIDVLSDGRMELGLGAGWAKPEYVQVGIHFDEPKVRMKRFIEGVDVITRLLAGEQVEHRGEYYRLREFQGAPLPVQPRIPLLIGGGGPRMIRFAAQRADIVAFVPRALPGGGLDPAQFAREAIADKLAVLDQALVEHPRAEAPERSVLVFEMGSSPHDLTGLRGLEPSIAAETPYALIGDTAAMVDQLVERRERWGLSYIVCFEGDVEKFVPLVKALAGK